jgi:hypothetical protein
MRGAVSFTVSTDLANTNACHCSTYYRATAKGSMQGEYHIGLGTLDDANGIAIDTAYVIDLKPDIYSFGARITPS